MTRITKKKYINIAFDNIEGPTFLRYHTCARPIGERWGYYVAQFPSMASARKAMRLYRQYLEEKGITKDATDYSNAYYADISNHSYNKVKLDQLKQETFYLND